MRSPDEVSEASTEHQFKKYSLRNKTKVNNSRVIVYSLKYNDLGDKIKGRNSEGLERAMSARIPFESPSSLLQSWRDSLAKYVCMTMPQVKDSEERCSCDNNKCHWIISWLLIEENLKKYTTGDSRCSEQPSKSIKTKSCVSYAARNFRYPNKDSYNSHLTANTAQSKKNI